MGDIAVSSIFGSPFLLLHELVESPEIFHELVESPEILFEVIPGNVDGDLVV